MLRLTRTGKIVFSVIAVLVAGFVFMTFFSGTEEERGPDLTQPAALPQGVNFPLKTDAQKQAFAKAAAPTRTKLSVCSFFSSYSQNRGIPIQFEAYIPDRARQSPYFYADPQTGREYWPAYYVAPTPQGLAVATAAADDDVENLNPCAQEAGTAIPVLIGFERGQKPTSALVRINGILWWDSLSVNPNQQNTSAGMETTAAPIVLAGSAEGMSASQVTAPAVKQRTLNMAFSRGPVILRLGRIEFASGQTRVWVELLNKTGKPLPAWIGTSAATLRQEGGQSLPAGTVDEQSDEGPDTAVATDTLPDEEIPAKGGGGLRGYLVFPEVDPNSTLFLNLPEINTVKEAEQLPITVRLTPDKNEDVTGASPASAG